MLKVEFQIANLIPMAGLTTIFPWNIDFYWLQHASNRIGTAMIIY